MNWKINQIIKGKKIYSRLQRMSYNHRIYISQHPAIGDAYLMGSYLKNRLNRQDILTCIGSASKEVYELYGFQNLIELTQNETDALIKFAQFMEISSDKIIILHYQALAEHTGIAFKFNGVCGLSFSDLLEAMIFRNFDGNRVYPNYTLDEKYGDLEKGNSVIFFPYANTLYAPPISFWDEIIEKYIKRKKRVYTYIGKNEKPLKRTKPITCKLDHICGLVEYAGEIVGVRNGIMDVISQTKCVKTIYYPANGAETWIHGSIMDFWSLNKLGYKTKCMEIEW